MVVDSTLTPSFPSSSGIDADLEPGQIVGEYRVETKLGQGGFGAVWKAVHPLIGKLVAIKVLSQRFSVDPEMVSRFVAEARAVNQIRHHNIIDIFSFGALEDGRHYYVMEYLDGETLDHRIRNQGGLPLRDALPILRALARALDAAHQKGIAHRDLKAENVFLATHPDGVFPKLLDFGIAKLLAPEDGLKHKTRTGAPMGTPHYMSPEQCHGRDVDHRTDIYAFGVLAYVMLTGVYPLDGEDYMTILMRQMHDDPPPASSHRPDLPEEVDRVIAWLMRKDPAERPPTLIDAVRRLEQAAGDDPGANSDPAVRTRLATAETPASLPPLPAYVPEKRTPGTPRIGVRPAYVSEDRTGDAPPAAVVSEIRTGEASRWPVSRRLLVIGALVAAVAVAAGIAARTAGRAGAPVPAQGSAGATAIAAAARDAGPADAAPQVADAAAPDAAPADVFVTLEGTPPNTKILRDGVVVGTAPGRVQLPRSGAEVTFIVSADGFVSATLVVIPADNLTRTVKLKPKVTYVRPPTPQPGNRAKAGSGGKAGSDEPTNEIEPFPPAKP